MGVPNVGKSSLINSLVRARATQTGNTPGVTRVAQSVHLDKHLMLLDSPGLVLGPAHAATSALHSFTKVGHNFQQVLRTKDLTCSHVRLVSTDCLLALLPQGHSYGLYDIMCSCYSNHKLQAMLTH